ncbi:MAG TPA: FAD-dependent oxidoreductase [Xanthobacteraceae bacterium]|nr:FAD-dependent oxidoreductase [Xanthobacteraceae bacterium]
MTEADPGVYGPTWYAATMVAAPERPSLGSDIDVDVCVIGAGLAGLTLARELARRNWSVAVLEARRVAAGASGRNGGVVSPGFAERIGAIVDRVGLPRAKELWALSDAGVEYIRRAIAETGMPGALMHDGQLAVRRVDDSQAMIDHAAMLRVDLGADVEAWPTEQVREVLRSTYYFQAVHFPKAFHLHPLNYALGLAAAAEKHGARIFENTSALSLDPAGVRKRVATPNGTVRARHVVLAGATGIGAIDRPIAETVIPVSSYVAVTAPLGEKLFAAIRYNGAIADDRRAGDTYRVVSDDRLMWGGRISTRISTPWRLKSMLRHDILRVYPQLAGLEIEYAWAGVMAYAVHKMPQIGELAPGYWLASAFGGHGLNTTAMAGEMIARAIMEGDDRWRLFSPYELVWAGGRLGRAAAQLAFWSTRARDGLHAKIARYRDRARREAEERQLRYAAEREANRIAAEQRRIEEEARRLADAEARRVAAEEARRQALEQAQLAAEAAEREKQERVETARLAAERAAREAADAAMVLARQIEEYKAAQAAEELIAVRAAAAQDASAPAAPMAPSAGTTGEAAPAVQDAAAAQIVAPAAPEPTVTFGKPKRGRRKGGAKAAENAATVLGARTPPDSSR